MLSLRIVISTASVAIVKSDKVIGLMNGKKTLA
jgi:hypothetical protein